jgi:hypothetical protein
MDASKDHGGEPAAKDLGVLLFLVAACPFGPHDSPHFSSPQILRRFAPVPYQIGELDG